LPTCACIAVWTQAALPLPTCVTVCARAGTAAANTMASIAANNITFFKSTSYSGSTSTDCIFSPLAHSVNTVANIFYGFLKVS
jgi:hypothetical protein